MNIIKQKLASKILGTRPEQLLKGLKLGELQSLKDLVDAEVERRKLAGTWPQ